MRRDGNRAKRLARATGVTASRLEAWSHKDKDGIAFLSPEDSPDDEALITALIAVGTEGRDRASTVLVVASRFGLACDGLKTALRRRLQLDDPKMRELTTALDVNEEGEVTDEGYAEAEQRATIVEAGMDADALSRAMRRQLAQSAPAYGETPEALQHSWATLLVTWASGGKPYYTPATPAILGVDAGEAGAYVRDDGTILLEPGGGFSPVGMMFEDALAGVSTFNMARVREVLDDVPAADLARMAPQLQSAARLLARIFDIPYDPERDEAAACFVPMLLASGSKAVAKLAAMGSFLAAMAPPQPEPTESPTGTG